MAAQLFLALHLLFASLSQINIHYLFWHEIEGRELAKQFGSRLIETSAKQRINVDEAFYNLVREIRRFNKETHSSMPQGGAYGYSQQGQGYGNQKSDSDEKGCCCIIM
jgi:GTPase KRas protein